MNNGYESNSPKQCTYMQVMLCTYATSLMSKQCCDANARLCNSDSILVTKLREALHCASLHAIPVLKCKLLQKLYAKQCHVTKRKDCQDCITQGHNIWQSYLEFGETLAEAYALCLGAAHSWRAVAGRVWLWPGCSCRGAWCRRAWRSALSRWAALSAREASSTCCIASSRLFTA